MIKESVMLMSVRSWTSIAKELNDIAADYKNDTNQRNSFKKHIVQYHYKSNYEGAPK